jgi:hypothetical protein
MATTNTSTSHYGWDIFGWDIFACDYLLQHEEPQREGAELQLPHISAALSNHHWRPLQSRLSIFHNRYNFAPRMLRRDLGKLDVDGDGEGLPE